jgi:hypothetical protein
MDARSQYPFRIIGLRSDTDVAEGTLDGVGLTRAKLEAVRPVLQEYYSSQALESDPLAYDKLMDRAYAETEDCLADDEEPGASVVLAVNLSFDVVEVQAGGSKAPAVDYTTSVLGGSITAGVALIAIVASVAVSVATGQPLGLLFGAAAISATAVAGATIMMNKRLQMGNWKMRVSAVGSTTRNMLYSQHPKVGKVLDLVATASRLHVDLCNAIEIMCVVKVAVDSSRQPVFLKDATPDDGPYTSSAREAYAEGRTYTLEEAQLYRSRLQTAFIITIRAISETVQDYLNDHSQFVGGGLVSWTGARMQSPMTDKQDVLADVLHLNCAWVLAKYVMYAERTEQQHTYKTRNFTSDFVPERVHAARPLHPSDWITKRLFQAENKARTMGLKFWKSRVELTEGVASWYFSTQHATTLYDPRDKDLVHDFPIGALWDALREDLAGAGCPTFLGKWESTRKVFADFGVYEFKGASHEKDVGDEYDALFWGPSDVERGEREQKGRPIGRLRAPVEDRNCLFVEWVYDPEDDVMQELGSRTGAVTRDAVLKTMQETFYATGVPRDQTFYATGVPRDQTRIGDIDDSGSDDDLGMPLPSAMAGILQPLDDDSVHLPTPQARDTEFADSLGLQRYDESRRNLSKISEASDEGSMVSGTGQSGAGRNDGGAAATGALMVGLCLALSVMGS